MMFQTSLQNTTMSKIELKSDHFSKINLLEMTAFSLLLQHKIELSHFINSLGLVTVLHILEYTYLTFRPNNIHYPSIYLPDPQNQHL